MENYNKTRTTIYIQDDKFNNVRLISYTDRKTITDIIDAALGRYIKAWQKDKAAKFRLEYNEIQQAFHFDNGTHEENTYGWVTISNFESDFKLSLFSNLMEEKYKPDLTAPIGKRKNKMPLKKVIQEWEWFNKIYAATYESL